jgi:hypothetical protein
VNDGAPRNTARRRAILCFLPEAYKTVADVDYAD